MSSAPAPGGRRRRAGGGWSCRSADANRLVNLLIAALKPQASVLYLAGRDRKEAVVEALAETFELEVIEAYAAEAREAWTASEAQALASCVAALHYSRRSAALAADLAKTAGVADGFRKLKHVCMSRDVAEPLQAIGAIGVAIAEAPNEAGLFRTLREEFSGFPSLRPSRI